GAAVPGPSLPCDGPARSRRLATLPVPLVDVFAVASAPGAAGVRVSPVMSRGRARGARPPPLQGGRVGYSPGQAKSEAAAVAKRLREAEAVLKVARRELSETSRGGSVRSPVD